MTNFLAEILSGTMAGSSTWNAALALIIAYLGGVLSSLTPCVYPMIPITVSVVGGLGPSHTGHTGSKRAWHEVWIRGAAYVGGMTVVYSFLGVLAGLTGKVFGTLTNTAGWYLALGVVMSLGALIMLDVLPFDPVVWWDTFKRKVWHRRTTPSQFQHQKKEMTLIGAFFLGASSGLIAAPCTTPALTTILAYIAKTQSIGMGLGLMMAFSLGLGTILLVISAFAGAVQILPRSGAWLKTMKVASGILLLAFAQYLFYRAGLAGGLS